MQNKKTEKIVVDKIKLQTLIRLGCDNTVIADKIIYNKFTSQNDELIDMLLQSLTDIKSFDNWGGKRENSGKKSSFNQDENQDEKIKMKKSSCVNQVVDKDKDKDKEIDKDNLNNNNLNNLNNINNTEKNEIKYHFKGKVIRLTEEDFWNFAKLCKNSVSNLYKELEYLDNYYYDNKVIDWWFRCQNALKKKEKQWKLEHEEEESEEEFDPDDENNAWRYVECFDGDKDF